MSSLFRVSPCSREPLPQESSSRRSAAARRAAALCAVVVFCAAAGGAHAAEWFATGEIRQEVEYDDNIGLNLSSDDAVSDVGFTSTILANAGARTPNLNILLDTRFTFTVFPNEDQLDSNDQFIVLGTDYQYGRSVWGLQGEFANDTTRTSDVDSTGLFILENKRRQVFRVGPSWSYQLTPRDNVATSATYTNVNYPNGTSEVEDGARLRDYEQFSGTVDYNHVLTPRTQLLGSVNGYYYDSNKFGSLDSQFVGVLLGASHRLTEQVRVTALAGPRVVRQEIRGETDNSSNSSTDAGYIADVSINYQPTERTFLEGQYTRTTEPNTSTGALLEKDEFRLYGRYKLLEKVAIDLTARYFMQDIPTNNAPDEDNSNATRHYVSVQPGVSWRFLEELSLNCYYRFRWQRYDSLGSDSGTQGNSNAVFARLIYDLPVLSASR